METLPLRTGRTNCVTNMQQDMVEQTLGPLICKVFVLCVASARTSFVTARYRRIRHPHGASGQNRKIAGTRP
jgi:hypothetical protein